MGKQLYLEIAKKGSIDNHYCHWISSQDYYINKQVSSMENLIPLGKYQHYKGPYYSVLGFARHSETGEVMVLYVPLYGEGGYWVRPLTMFTEELKIDGESRKRFTLVSSESYRHE